MADRYHVIPLGQEARDMPRGRSREPFHVAFMEKVAPYDLTREASAANCAACLVGECLQRVESHGAHELVVHDLAREMN